MELEETTLDYQKKSFNKSESFLNVFSVMRKSTTTKLFILMIFLFLFSTCELVFNNKIGTFPSQLYSYIYNNDKHNFKIVVQYFSIYVCGISICVGIKLLISDRLAVYYRKNIDNKIQNEYMRENAFYDLLISDAKLDNPDARITQDVIDYTQSIFTILSNILQSPAIIVWYSVKTILITNWKSYLYCLIYAFLSALISKLAMKPITKITYLFQKKEADFRLAHVKVKENAETICMSKGQRKEHLLLSEQLSNVLKVQRKLANVTIPMTFIINFIAYSGTLVEYICLYFYIKNYMITATPIELSSFTSKASFYFIMLIYGFTKIFNLMSSISKLSGYANRINELWNILEEHKKLVKNGNISDGFIVSNVDIQTPDGTLLIRNLSFKVNIGENLFIFGPSGCGKSSIFRVLGKLWPTNIGYLSTPESMMILTQNPYIPNASFCESVSFPKYFNEVIYDYYIDAIEFLQIKHLSERPENTWQQGLSPGERQRIALARIFICRPKYVLLDEATSAIPHSLEEKVFQKILSLGITMITISHNYRLKKYHKNILEVYGNRNYSFQKIQTNLN